MRVETLCELIHRKHLYDRNPSIFICKHQKPDATLQGTDDREARFGYQMNGWNVFMQFSRLYESVQEEIILDSNTF
jgi:hypothetical protein